MSTNSFDYLDSDVVYLDQACQSMRPFDVIESEMSYYTESNSCGGRGNHFLVEKVDKTINQTRKKILDFLGIVGDNYTVVFCPNTTYGVNLIFSNLNWENYEGVLTTKREHNSVLLPAISFSKKFDKKLTVTTLKENQLVAKAINQTSKSVCIFATTSNIDGQNIEDLEVSVKALKQSSNLVLLDATQSLAHHEFDFGHTDFDVLFGSMHKMYAPSGGFMVIKKELIRNLDQSWVGGGTVQKVEKNNYKLIDYASELHARLEFGLQDYAAIFGLNAALDWLQNFEIAKEYPKMDYDSNFSQKLQNQFLSAGPSKEAIFYLESLAEILYSQMLDMQKDGKIKLITPNSQPIISFVPKNSDSYTITKLLSDQNIAIRSGYMCCHNYIREVLRVPPIIRVSLGLHNTPKDLITFLRALAEVLS